MPRQPAESMPQQELLLRLRAAIDTATKYPSKENIRKALELAREHPQALRSSHVSHNLGSRRWEWLDANGLTLVGESVEIAGLTASKATITPDIKK